MRELLIVVMIIIQGYMLITHEHPAPLMPNIKTPIPVIIQDAEQVLQYKPGIVCVIDLTDPGRKKKVSCTDTMTGEIFDATPPHEAEI